MDVNFDMVSAVERFAHPAALIPQKSVEFVARILSAVLAELSPGRDCPVVNLRRVASYPRQDCLPLWCAM